MDLDDTDRRLIALLRGDARRSASSLAAALSVSRGTVQNRIARLLRGGVIQGFTLRLGPEAEGIGAGIRAITAIEIRGRSAAGVLRALKGFPEVRALHMTNGRWDIIAELGAECLEALDQALNRIRMLSMRPKVLQQALQPEPLRGHASLSACLLWRQRQEPFSCIVGQGVD
jgi:DNA-binding Lrp family transcriptional regulator